MRLRQLFETKDSVAIIFGRFNPPHKGHKAAWQMASKHPYWYVGTNQSTQGPKDPLPYDVKIQAMTAIWPEVADHIIAETSWLTMASKVYADHGEVVLFCLTDEDWVTKTIVQYNGKEGPHGFYNFPSIKQQPTPRLSSATALRDAVVKGDREAFGHAAGVPADTEVAGHPFFDLVAHYLMPYQNAPKKVAKKKAKEPTEMMAPPSGPNFSTDGGHHTLETKRMSAAVKLQRAWDRERAKTDSSRERMRRELELIANQNKKEEPKEKPSNEDGSDAIAHTAKSLTNPPKIMQHRARRDQEREAQLKYRDIAKRNEDAPKGWEGTVKSMKKHKDIDNPWALAHWMKNKGYKSHKK